MKLMVFNRLLNLCRSRIGQKEAMRTRFPRLLSYFKEKITFKTIKIAGTNGKGSTAAMLSACLTLSGRKTGLFTSPHLVSVSERFRVQDQELGLKQIAAAARRVETFLQQNGVRFTPSFFEALILIAIELFHEEQVEIAIFEAGVGGANDSVSLLPEILSLLTSIGLDHTKQLGDTLEEIARDKAGIGTGKAPLIVNSQIESKLKDLIEESTLRRKAVFWESANYLPVFKSKLGAVEAVVQLGDQTYTLTPSLRGHYQKQNINLVVEALRYLRQIKIIASLEIVKGIENAHWKARFELLEKHNQKWLLDAAHNPHALLALIESLDQVSQKTERIAVFGNSEEKDFKSLLSMLPAISNTFFFIDDFYKAVPQARLLRHFDRSQVKNIDRSDSLSVIQKLSACSENKLIVVTGSIFMIGSFRELLLAKKKEGGI